MAEMTPMMRQYLEVKERCKDCILFFRLGDFYEMFFEDAKVVSKELELVLTGKDCGLPERAPMCGIPYHASLSYIARLVSKGYKVAIGEQLEDPAKLYDQLYSSGVLGMIFDYIPTEEEDIIMSGVVDSIESIYKYSYNHRGVHLRQG